MWKKKFADTYHIYYMANSEHPVKLLSLGVSLC